MQWIIKYELNNPFGGGLYGPSQAHVAMMVRCLTKLWPYSVHSKVKHESKFCFQGVIL